MRDFYLTLILLLIPGLFTLLAQHREGEVEDAERLIDIFTQGHVHGHIRNYFMSTLNQAELKDYYADALGGAIRFETADFHGLHLGVAGIFTYKAFANDLNAPDPITGEFAKWEHELFDVLDFDNFNDLDRLEELYVTYNFQKGSITYGKLEIEETPLINRTDGRMKPYAFKGFWFNYNLNASNIIRVAWLDRISPRSTVEWFDFNEGIGLLDNGFQPDGSLASYHDHLSSDGLAMVSYDSRFGHLNIRAYQWYLHHISHTSWMQLEFGRKAIELGVQYALQFPDSYQRELEYGQRYVQPEEMGQVLSTKFAWNPGYWSLQGAYSHAFSSGRFLFPRELGRDRFYTSMSRSRMEGFGDTDVITMALDYSLAEGSFQAGISYTEIWGPATNELRYNKYRLDAYRQFNVHFEYRFHGFLEGTQMHALYVLKDNKQDDSADIIFNRSNYQQFNLVMNFEF